MMAEKITFNAALIDTDVERFWEYLERFYLHLTNKYGMQNARILIPEVLKKTFLERYPTGIVTLDGHEIPIYVNNRILVEESDESDNLATEVWVVGLW